MEHKLFDVFSYASGTRAEWVTLENGPSGLKFQDVMLKDYQIHCVANNLRFVLDYCKG